MSQNSSLHNSMQPLTIGNIITVSLYLYRTHLILYSRLSIIAYLWLLVPVYGWAKFFSNSALISRLAFSELIGKPESVKTASRYIRRRLWSFLFTAILVIIACFVILILSYILISIFLYGFSRLEPIKYIVRAIGSILTNSAFPRKYPLVAIFLGFSILFLLLAIVLVILIPSLWFYSRFFITNLLFAIENNISLFDGLNRSWKLTKSYFLRIQLILIIAITIFLPVGILIQLFGSIINQLASRIIINNSSTYPGFTSTLSYILPLGIILINSVVIMPFFQLIKAVIYYNLRVRKEGLDLELCISDRH